MGRCGTSSMIRIATTYWLHVVALVLLGPWIVLLVLWDGPWGLGPAYKIEVWWFGVPATATVVLLCCLRVAARRRTLVRAVATACVLVLLVPSLASAFQSWVTTVRSLPVLFSANGFDDLLVAQGSVKMVEIDSGWDRVCITHVPECGIMFPEPTRPERACDDLLGGRPGLSFRKRDWEKSVQWLPAKVSFAEWRPRCLTIDQDPELVAVSDDTVILRAGKP